MNPWWDIHVPLSVLLATAATLGYLIGRWRRSGQLCPQCKQQRMQSVALGSDRQADALQNT
jgi:hypothetical protein